MNERVRKYVVNLTFAWRLGAAKSNLSEHYLDVSIDGLDNYMHCGRSHTQCPNSLDNYFKLMCCNATKPKPNFE